DGPGCLRTDPMDRGHGTRLRAGNDLRLGSSSTPAAPLVARYRAHRWVYRPALRQCVRRPVYLVPAEDPLVDAAVLPQHQQVPAVVAIPDDDARPRAPPAPRVRCGGAPGAPSGAHQR